MKSFLAPFENKINYEDGLKLLENLKSFGCDWQQKDSTIQRDHNLDCSFISDVYYTDVNGVFPEIIAWVSYWNDVSDNEPSEVMTSQAHWEIIESIAKVQIGIKHMVHAMEIEGFGYDEIMTMRKAMEEHDFSGIVFI
jgi:hypothetical protein